MGRFGDYNNTQEIIEEKKRGARQQGFCILGEKSYKGWGAILYKNPKNEIHIDYFIFKRGMYKPLNWIDGLTIHHHRIPKNWIDKALPFETNYIINLYEQHMAEKA